MRGGGGPWPGCCFLALPPPLSKTLLKKQPQGVARGPGPLPAGPGCSSGAPAPPAWETDVPIQMAAKDKDRQRGALPSRRVGSWGGTSPPGPSPSWDLPVQSSGRKPLAVTQERGFYRKSRVQNGLLPIPQQLLLVGGRNANLRGVFHMRC